MPYNCKANCKVIKKKKLKYHNDIDISIQALKSVLS